jgi:hypothetical protein
MTRKRVVVFKGDRGGTIFRFVDKETGEPVSESLYLSYRADGKEHVCSTRTADLRDAKRDLDRLTVNKANAAEGLDVLRTPKMERLRVADLLDANLVRVKEQQLASADRSGIGRRPSSGFSGDCASWISDPSTPGTTQRSVSPSG